MSNIDDAGPDGAARERGDDTSTTTLTSAPRVPAWTTRQAVADALAALAETAKPSVAIDAASLLRVFATPAQAPRLLALVRSRDRPVWVRTYALRAHVATGAVLPVPVLAELLDEQVPGVEAYRPDPCSCRMCAPLANTLDLSEIVLLARAPEEERLVLALLERMPRDACAEMLSEMLFAEPRPTPAIMAWLERRWLAEIDEVEPTERDLWVARWSQKEWPHGLRVLLRHHGRGPRHGEDFWSDLERRPELSVLLDAATRREAALALALPLCDLLPILGNRGLRRAVKEAIHAHSFRERCPIADEQSSWRGYQRALRILEQWGDGPAVALGLLRGAVLAPSVRADLVIALFRRDRALARRVLSDRPGAADDREALVAVLGEMMRAPVDGDRPFLRAALRVNDAGVRYRAIEALDALGEDTHAEGAAAYDDVLRALARSGDALVRVRASFSLARHGDRAHAGALVAAATTDIDPTVRAEAVRRLGQLDGAEEHRALFEAALADGTPGRDDYHHPVAEQAAIALGCLGGERSMTPLIAAYFTIRSNPGASVIRAALAVNLAELEGRADLELPRRRRIEHEDWGWATGWSPVVVRRLEGVVD